MLTFDFLILNSFFAQEQLEPDTYDQSVFGRLRGDLLHPFFIDRSIGIYIAE